MKKNIANPIALTMLLLAEMPGVGNATTLKYRRTNIHQHLRQLETRPLLSVTLIVMLSMSLFLSMVPMEAQAAGGSYTIKWYAADPEYGRAPYLPTYNKLVPSSGVILPLPSGTVGRQSDPLKNAVAYGTSLSNNQLDAVTSLAPKDMILGQVVPFEMEITVKGSTAPENGCINVTTGFLTKTTSGDNFGYDPTYMIYCAFVDTADNGTKEIVGGQNAKVDSFTYTLINQGTSNEEIQGTFNISGLDNGDNVVVEVWVVLKNQIPPASGGNVQTQLISAKTANNDAISTGKQTVPLLQVKDFFTNKVDISVIKYDEPDPVNLSEYLNYTLIVKNNSPDTNANGINVTDKLDVNTTYVSASAPLGISYSYNVSQHTVTFGPFGLTAGNSTTLFINTTVKSTAPTLIDSSPTNPEAGSANLSTIGLHDLLNSVSVTAINEDPTPANNTYYQPTNVLGNPAINIEKYTNGEDADSAPGPYIPIGQTVTWTYNVTNTGNVKLTGVIVTDNRGVTVTAPKAELEPGESMTCTATGTATTGQYANIGTVIGNYGNIQVTDSDPSNYYGSSAAINIKKYTNGEDADSAPGPYIPIVGEVIWTYNVTNTGNVPLSNVKVADNVTGVTPVYVSGDLNSNNILETSEEWIYEATGTAVAGQYANTGTVTGNFTDVQVTDEDPSHYYGANASIDIEKYTNGEDADNPTGPYIPVGGDVTWTFEVKNTGNVDLTNVVVTDDKLGTVGTIGLLAVGETKTITATGIAVAGQYANIGTVNAVNENTNTPVTDSDPSHYYGSSAAISIVKYTNGEDADSAPGPYIPVGQTVAWTYYVTNTGNVKLTNVVVTDNVTGVTVSAPKTELEPGESMTCTATGKAVEGQYANIGTVNAVNENTNTPVTDSDPSHYYGANAAIDIEKYTNGEDADDITGPYIPVGEPVEWTYNVTNTGNVNLTDIIVTDDILGGINSIISKGDGDNILQPGEYWIFNTTGAATEGQYANNGTVIGNYGQTEVNDTDPSHYFGANAAISIVKFTNGEDANSTPGPYIPIGEEVTWTYNVTNTGNVNLTNVAVTDDKLGAVGTIDSLVVGETKTLTMTGTATEGQYANIGNVTGNYGDIQVTDSDPSHYYGANAAIDIEKSTNGEDADEITGPYIPVGEPVTWTYKVTNTGNVKLTNVMVTDDKGVTVSAPKIELQPGESMTCTATGIATEGQYANNGTAKGYYGQIEVNDTDPSHYYGANAAIDIEKFTNGEDADEPTGPVLNVGDKVTWEYIITNIGNVPLNEITVTDDQGVVPAYVSGDNGDKILQPGETWKYQATGTAVVGQYANMGAVTGKYNDAPVSAQDPSHYLVNAAPAIGIKKYTNGEDADSAPGPYIPVGGEITWTYDVTNTGNVDLTNVVVTDDKLGAVGTIDSLLVGETKTLTMTGTAVAGQYANIGTVTGNYGNIQVTDSDPSHYYGQGLTGKITPTGTTCSDYISGTAGDLGKAEYLVNEKNWAIKSVAPGVMFYYSTIHVSTAGNVEISVIQSKDSSTWPFIAAQDTKQVILYRPDCTKVAGTKVDLTDKSKITLTANLQPGTYYLGIKYSLSSLQGFNPVTPLYPTVKYTFVTVLNGNSIGQTDSIDMVPKNDKQASTLQTSTEQVNNNTQNNDTLNSTTQNNELNNIIQDNNTQDNNTLNNTLSNTQDNNTSNNNTQNNELNNITQDNNTLSNTQNNTIQNNTGSI